MTAHDSIKRKAIYRDINCSCGKKFTPKTSKQKLCCWQCRFKEMFEKSQKVGDCIEWPMKPGSHGYGQFTIDGWNTTSHTTSFRFFHGEIPKGAVIMHSCDNRMCINSDHLSIGTRSENIKDMWLKGRQQNFSNMPRGDNHPNTRFKEAEKIAIRNEFCGQSFTSIAKQLGCSKGTISSIFRSTAESGRKTEIIAQSPAKEL